METKVIDGTEYVVETIKGKGTCLVPKRTLITEKDLILGAKFQWKAIQIMLIKNHNNLWCIGGNSNNFYKLYSDAPRNDAAMLEFLNQD